MVLTVVLSHDAVQWIGIVVTVAVAVWVSWWRDKHDD